MAKNTDIEIPIIRIIYIIFEAYIMLLKEKKGGTIYSNLIGAVKVKVALISVLSIVAPTSRHKTTYTEIKC